MYFQKQVYLLIILSFVLYSCKKDNSVVPNTNKTNDTLWVAATDIQYFTPQSGGRGEYIKIFGHNFSTKKIAVKFGELDGEIYKTDSSSIITKVPNYSQPGLCAIKVNSDGNVYTFRDQFLLNGPSIESFSPTSGTGNVHVTIKGTGFSAIKWRNIVSIGGRVGIISSLTNDQMEVDIDLSPLYIGQYSIELMVDDITYSTPAKFELKSPWTKLSPLPVDAIAAGVTFELNNKIYYCTGCTSWLLKDSYTAYVLEYDVATNKWLKKNDFPGSIRKNAVGFSLDGYAYLGLGSLVSEGTANDFWRYDPKQDRWTVLNNFPGKPRQDAVAFAYNGQGYVLMGADAYDHAYNDFWVYTPETDKWDSLPHFPASYGGLFRMGISLNEGKLFVYDGRSTNDYIHEVWQFDLTTKTWTYLFHEEYTLIVPFWGNNKCYFLTTNNLFYLFKPEQNQFIQKQSFLGTERTYGDYGISLVFGNKLYFGAGPVGGGGVCENDFWSYDIE